MRVWVGVLGDVIIAAGLIFGRHRVKSSEKCPGVPVIDFNV